MRILAFPVIAALSAALMASTPAFAFGHGGFHGGGFHGGGFHSAGFHGGGFHRGRGFGGGAWPLAAGAGLGLGLLGAGAYYGYPYAYGADPYSYGYGGYPYYGTPAIDYSAAPAYTASSGLTTGRSVATTGQMGDYCTTPVKTCELYHTSIVGGGCSCRVEGGRSRGSVTQ